MQKLLERRTRPLTDSEPLDPEEVAAFLDGRLEGGDLERIQARLAGDPAARQEIIKVSRIIATAPAYQRRRTFTMPAVATLAAAAALAFVFLKPTDMPVGSVPVANERIGFADSGDRVGLTYPGDGETIGKLSEPFTWHGVPGASYRIIVSDADGKKVFEHNTTDTSAMVAKSLTRGARYFWSVDAFGSDGSSVTSGVNEFVVGGR